MSQATPTINESPSSKPASRKTETGSEHTVIDGVLQRLDPLVLPAKDHFAAYLRHKWRMHHKTRTMNSSFTSIMLFLDFYGRSGKGDIRDIERSDLEAFIEYEQDRGMYISTVRTRMASIIAFLHFLMEQEIIPGTFLKKRIRLKLPDTLPRAMNPNDVTKLIQVIDNYPGSRIDPPPPADRHADRRGPRPHHERHRSQ